MAADTEPTATPEAVATGHGTVGPSPRRRRLAPEVRRRQVLDAAVAVFSEHGFAGASMDDVAARAGVSKPSVYAHGGAKDELFAACLRRESDRLLHSIERAAARADPAGAGVGAGDGAGDRAEPAGPAARTPAGALPQIRLWLGLRAFFGALTAHRAGWLVLYRQAATGGFAADVDATRRRIVDRAAVLLAAELGARTAVVVPFAHTLVGAAEGLADWWLRHDPDTPGGAGAADEGAGVPTGDDAADVLARMVMAVAWPGLDALRRGEVWEPPLAASAAVSDAR